MAGDAGPFAGLGDGITQVGSPSLGLGRHVVTIPSLGPTLGDHPQLWTPNNHVGTIPRAQKRRPNYIVSFDPF